MWLLLTLLVFGILALAAYTSSIAVRATTGEPRRLGAARLSAYRVSTLTACAVFLLAYAFLSHAFRVRYVSCWSDRSILGGGPPARPTGTALQQPTRFAADDSHWRLTESTCAWPRKLACTQGAAQ